MTDTFVLGLDLGPNSIGWALIDEAAHRLVDCGVRVFPEGVDNFDTKKEKPRNEARRIARGMRRQIRRRAARKRRLRTALVSVGLLPDNPDALSALLSMDPYELRTRALDQPLAAFEIGRILLHLNQRRGFLSNRKRERKTTEVKGILAEMSELQADIESNGARTLGEFLHRKSQELDHCSREEGDHIRRRHTRREMLMSEFDAIWTAQAKHHPDLLTDRLRYGSAGKQHQPIKPRSRKAGESILDAFGIEGLLFFQRPLYWPRSIVGQCELEPKQKRCPRADRRAQRIRMLQEVNNLRYIDPDSGEERCLTADERALLLSKLERSAEMDFDKIRKALGFMESARFNLEGGKRKKIQGMVSDARMAAKSAIGPAWHEWPEDRKIDVVRLLAISTDDDETHELLVRECGLTADEADRALDVELPTGYVSLSVVAIERLLPHLERGLRLMGNDESDSAMHAAGYMRRDQLTRRVLDELPDPARSREARIGDIPNPVVKRALVELRKVVNSIIREYGKPVAIHVELAREVRQGPKARGEYSERIRDIEAERDAAADAIRDLKKQGIDVRVSRESILQYLLWKQQQHECIYCGSKISQSQLFGGDIDVDHILPYSRSLDDSQMNKVVCHRKCNAGKDKQTPYEWLAGSDAERYERVCQHVQSLMRKGLLPYKKYRRFVQKELKLDEFIARQLTATGYIASATVEYLKCLFEHEHDVLGLKGELTAELRRQWGLNDILRDDGLDLKSRDDHRHHAVDAIVVALTNRSRLQALSRIRKSGGVLRTGEALDFPWDTFREDVIERIDRTLVSHRSSRKVAGALHEDTVYGSTEKKDVFVVRKPLESLSPNEVELIRDRTIRGIVEARLKSNGIETGRGKKVDARMWREALANLAMPSGVPIRKVRVLRPEKTIRPLREEASAPTHVKPGSTHHVALFEWEEGGKRKRDAVFVTMLEATKRLKRREPIIQRDPPAKHETIPAHAWFLFSLSRGEMVLAQVDGREQLLVYNTSASTSGQMRFFLHLDARPLSAEDAAKKRKRMAFQPNTLIARKVVVDPLGRLRWAND